MNYAIRKIYTIDDGYHTVMSTTVGDTYTFDNTKVYDDNTSFFFQNPPGILVLGVNGRLDYFEGDTYVIVSYEDADAVQYLGSTFVTSCKVVLSGQTFDSATLATYFDFTQLISFNAYMWALNFKNYDQVVDYVTEESIMSNWVKHARSTEHDRFAPYIVDQEWIYYWATELDDSSFFDKLTDQQLLFSYCQYFMDRTALVKPKITDPQWVEVWNLTYPDDQIVDVTPTPTPVVTLEPTPEPEFIKVEVTPTPAEM